MTKYKRHNLAQDGFTLVELSIVILIIGLLLSGIAAGTSLIKQAMLNSVIADFRTYQTAYNSFLGRYGQVPGDFNGGDVIWTNCSGGGGGGGTHCTGNNNGLIDGSGIEQLAAWRELYLSGIASVSVLSPDDAVTPLTIGREVPASKVSGAGYMMIQGHGNIISTVGTSSPLWNDDKTNAIFLGAPSVFAPFLDHGGLTAQDAFSIDQKIDDGSVANSGTVFDGAQTGAVRTFMDPTITPASNTCFTNRNFRINQMLDHYNVAGTTATCVIGMALN